MHLRHVIGGEEVDSADGATFSSISPIDNSLLATVAQGGRPEVARAVAAARAAFGPWSRTPVARRRAPLHRVADLIDVKAGELVMARDPRAPFGGYRSAGIGREGGDHSRELYTKAKQVRAGHQTGGRGAGFRGRRAAGPGGGRRGACVRSVNRPRTAARTARDRTVLTSPITLVPAHGVVN
jgi:acyl-CoA reductase-like NAD-dependent aldehyde dehydrogenase